MPRTLVTLPCTARELEAALHAYCDHHGAWDATVNYDIAVPFVKLTLTPAPSESAANKNEGGAK